MGIGERAAGRGSLLLALLLATACPPSGPPEGSPGGPVMRRYTVRAEVVRLPDPGAPLREIVLRHEAIPDFVGQDGKVVGMPAMVMPLEVAPGLPLEGVRPGDKVEIVLRVDWTRPSYRVEQVRPLPAGAVLDLGRDAGR
jgi:Cu/Ag efflux protein CusF